MRIGAISAGSTTWRTSLEIAESMNAVDGMIRGCKNLGSTLWELGDLDRAAELERRGVEVARRFGIDFQLVWFETELATLAYTTATGTLRRRRSRASTGGCRRSGRTTWRRHPGHRAKIRAARGEPGVQPCVDHALDFGRRSGEPQVLFPALADAALIVATSGDADAGRRVAELFDELLEAVPGGVQGSYWSTEFALALALTDQPERFAVLDAAGPSRWLTIAQQIADGRYPAAADSWPRSAPGRTRRWPGCWRRESMSEQATEAGEAELRRAIGFWAGVGATRYVEMAEGLMAQTA